MAITLVQHNSQDAASNTSTTISFGAATTAGHIIIVGLRVGGTSTAAITDDHSGGTNTYNTDTSLAHASFGTLYIFSAPNAGAATTLTVTLTGGAATMRTAIYEYSGVATSTPLDKTSILYTSVGTPTSVNSGNTATTTQASELLFGALASNIPDTITVGVTQAYVLEDVQGAAGNTRLAVEDVTVSATGAYQADFGTSGSSSDYIVGIATYKAAAGADVLMGQGVM